MDEKVAIARALATLIVFSATLTGATAESYTVGEDRGWIVPNAGLNYTAWAENITSHVGDSLYFRYNPNAHNVLKVNESTYATCNISAPYLQTWDTGDTTVILEEAGTQYFICGAPNHCVMGQALAVEVHPVPSNVTPGGPNILSPPGRLGNQAQFSARPHTWLLVLFSSLVFFHYSS
ncbi:unnamed protein product [Calypogeia fissa]